MKKNYRLKGRTAFLISALVILLGFTACGSSNDPIKEEPVKPNPDTPVVEDDNFTVPASGGTIEKSDIAITFPNGTFENDSKVELTETAPAKITGEFACSKCYKVVLPKEGTAKEITISIKCDGDADKADVIVRMPSWNSHTSSFSDYNYYLDSESSGSTVSTILPLMQSYGDERPYFIIGLASNEEETGNGTRSSATRDDEYKYDVKWDIDIRRKYYRTGYDKSMENILETRLPRAFNKLKDLNFELPGQPIKFVFRDLDNTWGNWVGTKFSKIGCVELNAKYFLDLAQNMKENMLGEIDQTLLHEISHGIQAIVYDPRWWQTKRNLQETFGDEWAMVSEAIGSWLEKFAGDHHLGANSTRKEGKDNVKMFMSEFTPHYWSGTTYMYHGYGMSVFIEYLAKTAGEGKIVELYQHQKEGKEWKEALKEFMSAHDIKFFDDESYYSFALKALNGEYEELVRYDLIDKSFIYGDSKVSVKDTLFNYGVKVNTFQLRPTIVKANENKDIRITQENGGTRTYVYYDGDNGKLKLLAQVTPENPYTISIKEFGKLYGVTDMALYNGLESLHVISVREKNRDYNNTFADRLSYLFTVTENTASLSEVTFELVEAEEKKTESKYAISAIQISLGLRCNVIEYLENGKEGTIELFGGLEGFDYSESFDVSEDEEGHKCSFNYEYTDEWGNITETIVSFNVSGLDNLESVKVSNLKRMSKFTQSNTVETTELTVNGSIDLAGSIYDYGNGIYYSGLWELRGSAVESAEIDYTNYLKGRLWQKFSSIISDKDNSISVGLIFVKQD